MLNWMGGERQKGNLRLGKGYSNKTQLIEKLSPATVNPRIYCPTQVQTKTSNPQKERLTTQHATTAPVESINRGGVGHREQQFRQLSTQHKTATKRKQTKKTPKKTLTLRSLPRKTQNKP